MKLKYLIYAVVASMPVACSAVPVATLTLPFDGVRAYLMPWDNLLMSNMSPEKIRKYGYINLSSSNDLFASNLAEKLHIASIKNSTTQVKLSFVLHLVLDFYSGNKKETFLSDGKQLCTEDLKHCVDVDERFKQRFDPSYD